jgi:hypothetical protein
MTGLSTLDRSTPMKTVHSPLLLAALLFAFTGCHEPPTDPLAPGELPVAFGHINQGEGHGMGDGGKATITILQQPEVEPHPTIADLCLYPYSFQIEVKGKEMEVMWRTFWWGGDHGGEPNIGGNTAIVGSTVGPVVVSPAPAHPDDGHSFDALRILLLDDAGEVIAQADTEGRTLSCSR